MTELQLEYVGATQQYLKSVRNYIRVDYLSEKHLSELKYLKDKIEAILLGINLEMQNQQMINEVNSLQSFGNSTVN